MLHIAAVKSVANQLLGCFYSAILAHVYAIKAPNLNNLLSPAAETFGLFENKYFELKTRGAAAPTRNTCSLRSLLCHSQ